MAYKLNSLRGWITCTRDIGNVLEGMGMDKLAVPVVHSRSTTSNGEDVLHYTDVVVSPATLAYMDAMWATVAIWGLSPVLMSYTRDADGRDNAEYLSDWLDEYNYECTLCGGSGEYEDNRGLQHCGLCNSRLVPFVDWAGKEQHLDWGDYVYRRPDGAPQALPWPIIENREELHTGTATNPGPRMGEWCTTSISLDCGRRDCPASLRHATQLRAISTEVAFKAEAIAAGWLPHPVCGVLCPDCVKKGEDDDKEA